MELPSVETIIGGAFALGAIIGLIRSRINGLKDRVDKLEKCYDECPARKAAESRNHP